MRLTEQYFEARKEAIKWLGIPAHKRNFSQGLLILQKSGYKPQVAALLVRRGERDWTREKLMFCLRELLQVYYNPDDERFNVDGEDVDVLNDKAGESTIVEQEAAVQEVQVQKKWPEPIQKLMKHYADDYKERDICNKQRAALPDTNDKTVLAKRKELSERMDLLTTRMEKYWKLRQRYENGGGDPTDEEIDGILNGVKKESVKEEKEESYADMETSELQVKRKSAVTLRTRKENLLKYQYPSKRKEPNPMPDCPKRVKIERQIEHLTEAISKMDYELARRI